jgi:hypothetical protein
MTPPAAAEVLQRTLKDPMRPLTVADAEVQSGLARRDVEAGLHWLTSEYRGHLRVTEDGDLVHLFPTGFTKPWETRDALAKAASAIGRGLFAAGRFIVRAWLLVVMIAYAALFVALLIGLTFAGNRNDDRGSSAGVGLLGALFRMIADALFWTFHPWSPLYIAPVPEYGGYEQRREEPRDEVRFYEKVNRFVFGPPKPAVDPHAMRAKILAEIRAKNGRIGLADVMRVTGLPRDEADPLMAKLMLDHEGDVGVGEQGGIVYTFASLRRSADDRMPAPAPPPAWANKPALGPLTGNNAGANVGIVLLNLFNVAASGFVLANDLTISNIMLLFSKHPPPFLPFDGTPIALGLVPFVFSLALFAMPIARAIGRMREEKKLAHERARLAVLEKVLENAPKKRVVTDEALKTAYRVASGEEPTSKDITREVVALGGDVDTGPEGEIRYRFADLEAEAEALDEERAHASEGEKRLGKIVFASDA